jgi:hypothetical protein
LTGCSLDTRRTKTTLAELSGPPHGFVAHLSRTGICHAQPYLFPSAASAVPAALSRSCEGQDCVSRAPRARHRPKMQHSSRSRVKDAVQIRSKHGSSDEWHLTGRGKVPKGHDDCNQAHKKGGPMQTMTMTLHQHRVSVVPRPWGDRGGCSRELPVWAYRGFTQASQASGPTDKRRPA